MAIEAKGWPANRPDAMSHSRVPRPSHRTASRALAAVVAVTLGVALTGCTGDSPEDTDDAGSWTVLSYSIADTNLEPFMMTDIGEMASVGTQDNLNIVALVDRASGYTDEEVLDQGDWVGAKLLQIDPGTSTELADLGDVNTGDPALLADFITTGITDYPADHYSLIISDHGASWPGVGGDESSEEDSLSLAEIHEGIATGLDGAGIDKLDLLGFDACLMATQEVASDLAPLANRMLASQELEPGHGWDYNALSVVTGNGGATPDQLGSALIEGFEDQAISQETDAQITLSLIDLTKMDELDEALGTFTGQLVEQGADVAPVVGRSLASSLGFGRSPDPSQDLFMTDLGILAGEIGVDALQVSDAADDVVRAINDVVIDRVDGQATKGATGLSIYFPPQSTYFNPDYDALEADAGWGDFLAAYYTAGEEIPADEQAQFVDEDPDASFGDDGLTISGVFDLAAEDNLAEAYIRYGIVEEDNSVTYVGQEPADISDDGSGQASGVYDLTSLVITDGDDSVGAYFDLTTNADEGTATIDVPMAYYSPEDENGETYQDALLSLTIGADDDEFAEMYYAYNETTGNYGELTVEPTGVIVPEVLNVLGDGTEEWISTSDGGLYSDLDTLDYDLEALPSGTVLYIELVVIDFGGNYDSVDATVTVP